MGWVGRTLTPRHGMGRVHGRSIQATHNVACALAGVPSPPDGGLNPPMCNATRPSKDDIARGQRGRQLFNTQRVLELHVSTFLKWLKLQPPPDG
eukprot:scaffold116_cov334-Pavlova_lutheri.AAC.50